jgi:predicted short-subunit dehydrogenase-like oxidoreductase (DUF2520 family)
MFSKIVMIGAGNVATRLSIAFSEHGISPVQIYSRTERSAQKLSKLLDASYTTELSHIRTDADIYILAIKDDVLENIINEVPLRRDALYIHTAGSMPMSLFAGRMEHYGVLYPLMTLSKDVAIDTSKISFFIEANNKEDLNILSMLAKILSQNIYEITSEQRRYLHLASVFANNFTNHCFALAQILLKKSGLPFEVLLPIIQETVEKVSHVSPIDAQTGPAVRYDLNVMTAQLQLLSENPDMQQIYKDMSESIHLLSKEKDIK